MLHYATELKTIKEAFKMRVVVNEKALLLVSFDNQVYAIEDKCPHLGVSLAKGTLEDQHVTCKAHHAKIDVTTGEIIDKPKMLFVKVPIKKAKTYQVEIKNNKVFIHFPDALTKK